MLALPVWVFYVQYVAGEVWSISARMNGVLIFMMDASSVAIIVGQKYLDNKSRRGACT